MDIKTIALYYILINKDACKIHAEYYEKVNFFHLFPKDMHFLKDLRPLIVFSK